MSQLRVIAVHVEEPRPGRFAWVLSEREAGGWHALEQAGAPVASYRQAMADGLLALQALVQDLERGPRAADAAAPARRSRSRGAAAPPAPSYFGFGPAR